MKKIWTIAALICCCATAFSQGIVKGYVYEDINRNGKKDGKEKGISQVAVTNGVDVTLTDAKGFYQLPLGNDNPVFVIKPAGYQVPLNSKGLPQYFYIYKPLGSPNKGEFKGTDPTGKLPKSVDFGLYPAPDNDQFKALIFGDPQPYSLQEIEYFNKSIVSELKGVQGVSFGISLGDIAGNNLDLHAPYIEVMKQLNLPWYNVMGNHDRNFEAEEDSQSDESFEAHFGPVNTAFNYGKAHFIILDDILAPDPRNNKKADGYWAGFRKDQLDFVENDLKYVPKDHLIVISVHIPLDNPKGKLSAFREADRHRLFDLIKDYPNILVLSAHTHVQQQFFYGKASGWMKEKPLYEYNAGTTCGSWYSGEINERGVPDATMADGTPSGYAFLNVNGNQYTIDYKVAGKPKDYQMTIYNPKVLARNKKTSASIYVNFFMGSGNDKVQVRVDKGDWKKMTNVDAYDPSYLEILYKWDSTDKVLPGRRPGAPVSCTHLWKAPVPTDLPVGVHEIEVKATDMFGRSFTQKSTYTIK